MFFHESEVVRSRSVVVSREVSGGGGGGGGVSGGGGGGGVSGGGGGGGRNAVMSHNSKPILCDYCEIFNFAMAFHNNFTILSQMNSKFSKFVRFL